MKTTAQMAIDALGGAGILTETDLPSLSEAEQRIAGLLGDGKWHSASIIIAYSGQREGLRRLRALRQRGFIVERKRDGVSRDYLYRIAGPIHISTKIAS